MDCALNLPRFAWWNHFEMLTLNNYNSLMQYYENIFAVGPNQRCKIPPNYAKLFGQTHFLKSTMQKYKKKIPEHNMVKCNPVRLHSTLLLFFSRVFCRGMGLARGQKLNTNFVFSNFRAPPGYPSNIRPKKFVFPGFEGHTEVFGPHPFTWKTPTPPENIQTQKLGFVLFFRAWANLWRWVIFWRRLFLLTVEVFYDRAWTNRGVQNRFWGGVLCPFWGRGFMLCFPLPWVFHPVCLSLRCD